MTELRLTSPPAPASVVPIEQLAPNLASLLADSAGPIAVAVVVPDQNVIYVGGETRQFALASAVKVPLMLAVLERAQTEGRALRVQEQQLINVMITRSDNTATSTVWEQLGRGTGVQQYLAHLGSPDLTWGADAFWGDTAASAPELAELLAHVLNDETIGADEQAIALSLLQDVAPDQRWGVSAGLNLEDQSGVQLGVKDGWYREVDGWRITSTGLVIVEDGPSYSLVILTDQQPEFEEGVWTLEHIAAEVHRALLPQSMTAALSLTDFTAQTPASEAMVASAEGEATATATPSPTTPTAPTSTPTAPAASVAFRPLDGAPGVLVPAAAVAIAQEQQREAVSFWFEVPGGNRAALIHDYRLAMEQAGWSVQSAGTQLVLTNGGSYVMAGAHEQRADQTVLNLVVGLPHATASATLEP